MVERCVYNMFKFLKLKSVKNIVCVDDCDYCMSHCVLNGLVVYTNNPSSESNLNAICKIRDPKGMIELIDKNDNIIHDPNIFVYYNYNE